MAITSSIDREKREEYDLSSYPELQLQWLAPLIITIVFSSTCWVNKHRAPSAQAWKPVCFNMFGKLNLMIHWTNLCQLLFFLLILPNTVGIMIMF